MVFYFLDLIFEDDPCILCGKPVDGCNKASSPLLLAWNASCGRSLCELFELDETLSSYFVSCSYCDSCQILIRNIDFSQKTLKKLKGMLSSYRHSYESLLKKNYRTLAKCEKFGETRYGKRLQKIHDILLSNQISLVGDLDSTQSQDQKQLLRKKRLLINQKRNNRKSVSGFKAKIESEKLASEEESFEYQTQHSNSDLALLEQDLCTKSEPCIETQNSIQNSTGEFSSFGYEANHSITNEQTKPKRQLKKSKAQRTKKIGKSLYRKAPFESCNFCGMVLKEGNLTEHTNMHEMKAKAQFPFGCVLCDENHHVFTNSIDLKAHVRHSHGSGLKCFKCEKVFSQEFKLY